MGEGQHNEERSEMNDMCSGWRDNQGAQMLIYTAPVKRSCKKKPNFDTGVK